MSDVSSGVGGAGGRGDTSSGGGGGMKAGDLGGGGARYESTGGGPLYTGRSRILSVLIRPLLLYGFTLVPGGEGGGIGGVSGRPLGAVSDISPSSGEGERVRARAFRGERE